MSAMIDLGLVDSGGLVGLEIEPSLYDALRRSGLLKGKLRRQYRLASGQFAVTESGLVLAQLLNPLTGQGVSPAVPGYAGRGAFGLDSQVGVVFFHKLVGCRVQWDLGSRTWCIEYP